MRTPLEIVNQTNALARKLYALRGYEVPANYHFEMTAHPHEREAWAGAREAQIMLTDTDPDDAVDELLG